jgi:hypothetical protein
MQLRYPDQPVEIFPDNLDSQDNGTSMAQQKVDGYHCLLTRDTNHNVIREFGGNANWDVGEGIFFLSRRGVNKGGPTRLDVSREIVEVIKKLALPDNTMLDAEWLERRTKEDGIGDCLFIHDVLWLEDKWFGDVSCWDRFNLLAKLLDGIRCDTGVVRIVDFVIHDFRVFFEAQRKTPWSEGIVIKDMSHKIKGSRTECQKNPLWLKVKWRSGCDGRKVLKS